MGITIFGGDPVATTRIARPCSSNLVIGLALSAATTTMQQGWYATQELAGRHGRGDHDELMKGAVCSGVPAAVYDN